MENEIRVGRAPARHVDDGESLLVVDDLKTNFAVAAVSTPRPTRRRPVRSSTPEKN
jgi:hypothetical protein